MRYFSDVTKKIYETEDALIKAETEVIEARKAKEEKEKKLKNERAARAKVVEEAIENAKKAQSDANMLLKDFIKDYGSYHSSVTKTEPTLSLFDFFDLF